MSDEARGQELKQFKREQRYVVFKLKDIDEYLSTADKFMLEFLSDRIDAGRTADIRGSLMCVVVESSWPEYDPTWKAIEARFTNTRAPDKAAEVSECIHCGELLAGDDSDLNHWESCKNHPAKIEVEKLREEEQKLQQQVRDSAAQYATLAGNAENIITERDDALAEIKMLKHERDQVSLEFNNACHERYRSNMKAFDEYKAEVERLKGINENYRADLKHQKSSRNALLGERDDLKRKLEVARKLYKNYPTSRGDVCDDVMEKAWVALGKALKETAIETSEVQEVGDKWMPISTAKKAEGSKILCYGDGYVFEAECECDDGYCWWTNIGGSNATHWMPLPISPIEESETQNEQ